MLALTTCVVSWLTRFATRVVARRLDVPENVVQGICLYVAAYIGEVGRNASLVCPAYSMTCDVIACRLRQGHPRAHRPDTNPQPVRNLP